MKRVFREGDEGSVICGSCRGRADCLTRQNFAVIDCTGFEEDRETPLKAENARLREALGNVATTVDCGYGSWKQVAEDAGDIARAALKGAE